MKKNLLLISFIILFLNCWKTVYVSDINDLEKLGIQKDNVVRVDTLENVLRVYYKIK